MALASLGSCGGLHSHDGVIFESAGCAAVIIAHAARAWKQGGCAWYRYLAAVGARRRERRARI
jgi:hypothetical protein